MHEGRNQLSFQDRMRLNLQDRMRRRLAEIPDIQCSESEDCFRWTYVAEEGLSSYLLLPLPPYSWDQTWFERGASVEGHQLRYPVKLKLTTLAMPLDLPGIAADLLDEQKEYPLITLIEGTPVDSSLVYRYLAQANGREDYIRRISLLMSAYMRVFAPRRYEPSRAAYCDEPAILNEYYIETTAERAGALEEAKQILSRARSLVMAIRSF